jgi:hypothetical protein
MRISAHAGTGLGCLVFLAGCGSTQTVTVHSPEPARTATTAAPKRPQQRPVVRLNNPAQRPDPSVTTYCNEVPVGHPCRAVTAAPEDPNVAPQRNCDTNIVANSRTSCGLAENAFYEYYETHSVGSKRFASIGVHSPTTGRDYELGCEQHGALVGCVSSPTADYIFVDFPIAAVETYSDAQARAYAARRDVGHPTAPYEPPEESEQEGGSGEDEVGSYSHAGDESFCDEHECIGDFETDGGYVVECADGSYSHAGGIQGACSHHGGES